MTPKQLSNIQRGLSTAKLLTYENLGFKNESIELIRAYFALQEISAHFLVPLQMLELSLRNNIHTALQKKFPAQDHNGQLWFTHIPRSKTSKDQVASAEASAKRKKPAPSPDDIVCELTLGFWVYLLDKCYQEHTNPKRIWPFITSEVFPNKKNTTIDSIFNLLKSINTNRNRLYHHEPIWKHRSVTSFKDATSRMKAVYLNIMNALDFVCPEKKSMLDSMQFNQKFNACCTQYEAEFITTPFLIKTT